MSVNVIHGTCPDALTAYDDASFDAVVTDPPYELSKHGEASAGRIAAEVVFPKQAHAPALFTQDDELPFLLGKVADLCAGRLIPGPTATVPIGAVALNDDPAGRDNEIADAEVATVGEPKRDGSNEIDAEGLEYLGCFALKLRDVEAAVDLFNGAASGFLSGTLGVGLALAPASLPSLLGRSGAVVVADENVGALDDALTALIGTPWGAEQAAVPCPFQIGRAPDDGDTAGSALVLLGLAALAGAQLVRARPRAGRLPAMLQPRRVRLVDGPTGGALSFDLLIHDRQLTSGGFMGKAWDGSKIAFDVAFWREVWRVLKPGGHIVAFGGTRTYHRLASAIEDAGFEIRDELMWLQGSGFPKSLDVSKAIDKAAGAEREVVGVGVGAGSQNTASLGAFAPTYDATAPATPEAERWHGWGTALKPAHEPICLARKPLAGTVAANVLAHGTGALNIDGCRVGTEGGTKAGERQRKPDGRPTRWGEGSTGARNTIEHLDAGRWPANVVMDEEAAALLDQQSGTSTSRIGVNPTLGRSGGILGSPAPRPDAGEPKGYADSGGASRFFYVAKAPKHERPRLADGTAHATVKPVALMRWLVRLITPPGGHILDPFAGTGTTGEAAIAEGFDCTLIEQDEAHVRLIEQRLAKPIPMSLLGVNP